MKRLFFALLLVFCYSPRLRAQYEEVPLDEVVHFDCPLTHDPTSSPAGALANADSTPTFSIKEEATDTAIVSGSVTARSSTTGEYRGTYTASAANGFELGKWYIGKCYATVSSVSDAAIFAHFRIKAAEDSAGYVKVTVKDGTGTGEIDTASGLVKANVTQADGAALTSHGAGKFPADVLMVDSAALTSHGAGKFPADLLMVDSASLTAHAAGKVPADVLTIAGTSQTARDIGASVLLSNGTGTGQLKLASGYVAMTWADIAAPTTSVNFSGSTFGTVSMVTAVATGVISQMFSTSGGTYATAAANSVVKQIADNSGGSSLTLADIADSVWDELLSGHTTVGSAGKKLSDAAAGTNPWDDLTASHTTAGTYGKLLNDDLNASIAAVKAKTDALTFTVSNKLDANVYTWNGTAVASPDTAGYVKATIKDGTGTGEIDTSSGGIAHVILSDTITTYTGNTKQTGDTYVRLGAPAGASIAADIAARAGYSFKKATAAIWIIQIFSTATGNPLPSTAVTCTRALDNVTFGAGTVSATTTSADGLSIVSLGTGDTTANQVMTLKCTASGGDTIYERFKIEAP